MRIKKKTEKENWLKFLGTAGARFVVMKQLRASGGIWLSYKGTNILIDPGPGSLVKCSTSRPKLDPAKLDAIILTHKHLDHSNDINVMIEAMTEGGFKKRGLVFAPQDAVEVDPVILKHVRNFPQEIIFLKEAKSYSIGSLNLFIPQRQIHPVETYGLKFSFDKQTLSFIVDTRYSSNLKDYYQADTIIINTVFYEARPGIDHLCLNDAIEIIQNICPKQAILTHFGMTMLKARPHEIAQRLTKELNLNIIAAYDGLTLPLGH